MHRSPLSRFSYLCLFAAAAASLATSQPAPDWVIEDTATGEVTLSPDADETFVHLRVSSHVVSSELSIQVALDPPPPRPPTGNLGATDVSDTPILLFVGIPTVVTPGVPAPTTRLVALPTVTGPSADGFEPASSAQVPIDTDEALDVRITWKSTLEDRLATKTETSGSSTITGRVERPVAPRRPMKVRWRARLYIGGFGDRPAGGTVHVEPAS